MGFGLVSYFFVFFFLFLIILLYNIILGLEYVRVDVWEKIIKVCEWYDGCEGVLFIF